MPSSVSSYPLSQAARAQAVGILAVLTGLGVLAVLGLGMAGPDPLRWVAVGLTLLLAVALAIAVVRLVRPPVVLELADEGYRVRSLRGVGVRQAAWRDVQGVQSRSRDGQQVVIVRLEGTERSTCLPVHLIGAPARTWLADLDARLDAAHGQRRLR